LSALFPSRQDAIEQYKNRYDQQVKDSLKKDGDGSKNSAYEQFMALAAALRKEAGEAQDQAS